jgi:hypothetical protein
MAAAASLSIKLQNWGDDLRLPTLLEPAPILKQVEALRRAPIPLQSKHLPALKRNVWYTLRRPADRSRMGLLCVLPSEQCCVYVSGEPVTPRKPQRVGLLRLRVDPQFFAADAGPTVFAATLSAAARKLWVEDVILWKGRAVHEEETFQKRWELTAQWLEHYCIMDPRLLGGIDIEMANWQALEDMEPTGVWEIIQDQTGCRRLLWIATMGAKTEPAMPMLPPSPTLTPSPLSTPTLRATPAPELPAVPTLDVVDGPLIAIAVKESGPDQWSLKSVDDVSLGRALIRTLSVSAALRSAGVGQRVHVSWNPIFTKWEIVALTVEPASHSRVFVVS